MSPVDGGSSNGSDQHVDPGQDALHQGYGPAAGLDTCVKVSPVDRGSSNGSDEHVDPGQDAPHQGYGPAAGLEILQHPPFMIIEYD
jgi:hypothetical protein